MYKQKCANENGYSIIRIFQEDVLYDNIDWVARLSASISEIINDHTNLPNNVYISKDYLLYDKYRNV
jgi:hypothetical protein